MIRILILFISLIGAQCLFAQNLSGLLSKSLTYEAFFIEPNGDTLTKETIVFVFKNSPWQYDKTQNELSITYNIDTLGVRSFINPLEKRRKKYVKYQKKKEQGKKGWENWTWLDKEEVTGYKLNDSIFWMHPPRDNQYIYNQMSGMPEVELNQLAIGGNWQKSLFITIGWGDFKGTLESKYQVKGKKPYKNEDVSVSEAWEIEGIHSHSKLGESQSRIIFDETQFGFLQFDNLFYDGRRIVISLIEIKTTLNT